MKRAWPTSIVLSLLAAPALAEEIQEESAQDPVEVRIVGQKADAIQKIPGSLTVIDKQEIEQTHAIDTAELLRRVPGLNVREDTSGGGRLDIGIRGLDPGRSRRLLVLEDGVPLAINPYAEADLYFVPQVERMIRVEVLKGSGSILFGPQTIGGVVNFGTVLPPYRTESYVSVEAGEHGYARTIARFGTALPAGSDREPVRVLTQVVVKGGDGPREAAFTDHDALFKMVFPTGPRGQATLKLAGHHARAVSEDVGLTSAMFAEDPRRPALSPDSRLALSRFDGAFTHEIDLGHGLSLKTLAYGTYTERVWRRQRYDRIPSPSARYERIVGDVDVPLGAIYFLDAARVLDRGYWVAGLEPRLTARVATGEIDHTIDAGLRVLVEGAGLDELDAISAGAQGGRLVASEEHRTIAFAAYAQDRIAFRPWLVVTPGVRLEVARFDRDVELTPAGDSGAGGTDVLAVVPGIGATAGVPAIHAFAGVHLGFAPPRITTAIGAQGQSELLDPERSTNYEVGLRSQPSRAFFGEATFFLQRFTNQIVPNTTPGGITELVNAGATQSFGGDFAAQVRLGEEFDLGADIDLTARAGVFRSEFLSGPVEGNSLPYAPTYTVSGTAFGGIPSLGISLGVTVTHVGPQFADDANTVAEDITGRTGEIDAYTVLDLVARYDEKHSGVGVFATAKSLLDDPFIIARRPEGIHTSGFRQVNVGLSHRLP